MTKNWTVIANRIKAKYFEPYKSPQNRPAKALKLIEELSNPLGRERNKALKHSQPGQGRFSPSTRASRPYQMSGEKSPHEDAAKAFAKLICRDLEKKHYDKTFDSLVMVAEPHFLGLLKKNMKKALKKAVVQWVAKDLPKVSDKFYLENFKSLTLNSAP